MDSPVSLTVPSSDSIEIVGLAYMCLQFVFK